jgi:uncharacterized membrane protein
MGGAIIILVAMFVVGPIGTFAVGAIWSALHGELESMDADDRVNAPPSAAG